MEDDQRLGRHIVGLYSEQKSRANDNLIDTKLLTRYISVAKVTCPTLSNEAVDALTEGYVGLRKLNGSSGKTVSATTRQLESLIRLSEAHAKMRYA